MDNKTTFIEELRGVRYQVKDVARAVMFYTEKLGFTLVKQHKPAFAEVSIGSLQLILSGPGASGSRAMPDGRAQEPGGWNRVVLRVQDLPARITELKKEGVKFRNEMEVGTGGKQIQIEDPDGNPIELFESNRMKSDFIVVTAAKARPGKEQSVQQALCDVAQAARTQPGCVQYSVLQSNDNPTVTLNVERWTSKEERDTFLKGTDVQKFAAAVSGMFVEPPQPETYEMLNGM